MEKHEASPASEEVIEVSITFLRPAAVPIVEDESVGFLELLVGGPIPGSGNGDIFPFCEQLLPGFLPGGVIMLTGAMILFVGDEDEVDSRLGWRSGGGLSEEGVELSGGASRWFMEEKDHEIAKLRLFKVVDKALGHERNIADAEGFNFASLKDLFATRGIEEAECFGSLAAEQAGGGITVFEGEVVSDVVGVDEGIGFAEVAEDRSSIAVGEVGEIGAESGSFTADAMTGGTLEGLSKKEGPAALEITAFGGRRLCG
jgi:hypothetical protein